MKAILDKKHHPFREDFPLQNIHDLWYPQPDSLNKIYVNGLV